eukprot:g6163.t1
MRPDSPTHEQGLQEEQKSDQQDEISTEQSLADDQDTNLSTGLMPSSDFTAPEEPHTDPNRLAPAGGRNVKIYGAKSTLIVLCLLTDSLQVENFSLWKKAKAVSSHLSNLYTLVNMRQLKAAYFPDADARDNANRLTCPQLAKQIVAGDVVWKRVVDKELGRLGDGEGSDEERYGKDGEDGLRPPPFKSQRLDVGSEELNKALAEQKKLQKQLDRHRQVDEGGKKVTFTTRCWDKCNRRTAC